MIITSCRKDTNNNNNSLPEEPTIPNNTAPVANAGKKEITYFIYKDTSYNIQLKGSATDKENNIQNYHWKKISGPSSYIIENKDSLQTNIHQLTIGAYEFELTVTDTKGLSGKDITKVIIKKKTDIQYINENEIIINNLEWVFPWYAGVEIPNFMYSFPPDSDFKIFIQRYNNGKWIEVNEIDWNSYDPSILYSYTIFTYYTSFYRYSSLYIWYFGYDYEDKPSVKIMY
jgi:hypothetical protein